MRNIEETMLPKQWWKCEACCHKVKRKKISTDAFKGKDASEGEGNNTNKVNMAKAQFCKVAVALENISPSN